MGWKATRANISNFVLTFLRCWKMLEKKEKSTLTIEPSPMDDVTYDNSGGFELSCMSYARAFHNFGKSQIFFRCCWAAGYGSRSSWNWIYFISSSSSMMMMRGGLFYALFILGLAARVHWRSYEIMSTISNRNIDLEHHRFVLVDIYVLGAASNTFHIRKWKSFVQQEQKNDANCWGSSFLSLCEKFQKISKKMQRIENWDVCNSDANSVSSELSFFISRNDCEKSVGCFSAKEFSCLRRSAE